MTDAGSNLMVGDKVQVVEGDLQKTKGKIVELLDSGNIIVIKPTNIPFDENISLDKTQVKKYFEMGDGVRVINGKHVGETGIVMLLSDGDTLETRVKLSSTGQEHLVSSSFLKLKTDKVDEGFEQRTKVAADGQIVKYQVGDVVQYDQTRYGYVIQDNFDSLKVVTDRSTIAKWKPKEVKKVEMTRMD